jgi:hypothetical protein
MRSDESRPTERKGEPQHRHPRSATLRATAAGSDGSVSTAPERTTTSLSAEKQVQLSNEAVGPKGLSAFLAGNQSALNADPGAGKDLAGEVACEAQATSFPGPASPVAPIASTATAADPSLGKITREAQTSGSPVCALPRTPGGSDDVGAGPQQYSDSNPRLVSSPTSKYEDTQGEAGNSAEAVQGAEVGQSQHDAAQSHSSPDEGPTAAVPGGGRSISTQPTDNASLVGEISPFIELMGQEAFGWTTGASPDLAELPKNGTASGSKAAQESAGNSVRENQATASTERGASGETDSASSASSSKTSPSSGGNKSSADAHAGDHGSVADSSQISQGRVDTTSDSSSSPKAFALPAQPSGTSSAEGPTASTPEGASVPNPAASSGLDAWGDLAARAGRIVTSATLSEGTNQAEMRVELRTEALGAMQLTASLEGDRVGAVIGVQTPAAHSWLVTELPALHQAFANQNLHLDSVSILDRGGSNGSLDGNTGGQRGFGSPSDEPPRSNSGQVQSGAPVAIADQASSEVEAWPAARLSGRLSVRA